MSGVKAMAPQTVSESPRRTLMICLPVGWTPPYNPLTGRRRPRMGKRASRLNLMVVRWGSEHCDGAELVSAYVELSSCVWTYLGLKRLLGVPPRVPTGTVRTDTDTLRTRALRWDLGYVPKGSLRSAYEHYVGTKLASLGDAERYLRLRRRYYLAEPSVGTLGNKAAKLTCGDATDAR